MNNRNKKQLFALALSIGLFAAARCAMAGDIDLKLTTNNGGTKLTVQDSGSVEVSSITSDGDAYFTTVNTTSGTMVDKLVVGDVLIEGTGGANQDNYIAVPFTAAAAGVTAKNVVVLTQNGTVQSVATASSNTVVGIAVTTTAGGGKAWVATHGIVSGVTCNTPMSVGTRVCSSAGTAGRIGTCSVATTNYLSVGRIISACNAAGTTTVVLEIQ